MTAHQHYQKRSVQLHNLRRQVEAVSVPAWLYIGKMYLVYIIEKELHELAMLMSAGIVRVGFVPDATNDTSLTDSEWKVAAGLFRAEGIRLTEENERLRDALKFYANNENWIGMASPMNWSDFSNAGRDNGFIAMRALREAGGQQ